MFNELYYGNGRDETDRVFDEDEDYGDSPLDVYCEKQTQLENQILYTVKSAGCVSLKDLENKFSTVYINEIERTVMGLLINGSLKLTT